MRERNVTNTLVKIPTGLLERIDRDVAQTGDFRNRSEWIIAAIRSYELERTDLIAKRKAADAEIVRDDIALETGRDIGASPASDAKR